MAILFNLIFFEQEQKQYHFIFYDLAIHSIAIGFIGITVALYLPLILPPIIGKIIHFTDFNKIPLLLIILSLSIRAFGDFVLTQRSPLSYYSSSLQQQDTWILSYDEWVLREIDKRLNSTRIRHNPELEPVIEIKS
jgi:hypothetical protein